MHLAYAFKKLMGPEMRASQAFSVAWPVLRFHVMSVSIRTRATCIFYESDGKCSKLRMYQLLFNSLFNGSLKYNTASSQAFEFSVAGPVLRNFPLDGRRGSNVYIAH